jgi:hypothetical protein
MDRGSAVRRDFCLEAEGNVEKPESGYRKPERGTSDSFSAVHALAARRARVSQLDRGNPSRRGGLKPPSLVNGPAPAGPLVVCYFRNRAATRFSAPPATINSWAAGLSGGKGNDFPSMVRMDLPLSMVISGPTVVGVRSGDGRTQTKGEVVESLKARKQSAAPPAKFVTEAVEARREGDAVILTGRLVQQSERDGEAMTMRFSSVTPTLTCSEMDAGRSSLHTSRGFSAHASEPS